MSQIDGWYKPDSGRQYTIIGCPRKGCRTRAKAYDVDGPWELLGANEQPDGRRIAGLGNASCTPENRLMLFLLFPINECLPADLSASLSLRSQARYERFWIELKRAKFAGF